MDAPRGVLREEVTGVSTVSAVIVNYNAGPLLLDSVRALLEHNGDAEAIVIDNGSADGSLELLRSKLGGHPRLTVIETGANLGFAKAANIGLARARGEFLLLLNPDCVVLPGSVATVVETMRAAPEVGMAGCLIRHPDGSEQPGCRRAVPTPWRSLVRVLRLDRLFPRHPRFRSFVLAHEPLPRGPVLVEAISGAFMLVRRSAFETVGPLDEGYFLHCEDLDWCMRFRQKGWKIVFVPDVSVVHAQGTCSCTRPIRVEWHKHRGMMRFYRKFFRDRYPLPLMGLITVGVWIHFALLVVVHSVRHIGRRGGVVRGNRRVGVLGERVGR